MADQEIDDRGELAAIPALTDKLVVRDLSDTTDTAGGTDKWVSYLNLIGQVQLQGCCYVQNDNNAYTRGALQVTLPYDCTIVKVEYRNGSGLLDNSDASNFRTMDVRYRSSAGGSWAGGTSLISTPLQSDDATFTGDAPGQLFDLGADQNLTRDAGDVIYAHFEETMNGPQFSAYGDALIVTIVPR